MREGGVVGAGKGAIVFLAAATVTATTLINYCDLVFQCGCRFLWAGAADSCNIHSATGPHCPWCAHGGYAAYAAFGLILAAQGAIAWGGFAGNLLNRLFWALLAYPLIGGAVALVSGLVAGYWSG
jgi:hypothetical protein